MSLPFRVAGICAALVLATLAAGCRQLKVTGAPDLCPTEERLTDEEVRTCWDKHETTLNTRRPIADSTGGGRLRGAALPIAGRRLRHAVALDYSGSMYGGYDDEEPGASPCGWHFEDNRHVRNGTYYWEKPEFAQFLADGPLGALTGTEPVHPMAFNHSVTVLGADGTFSTFDEAAGRFPGTLPPPVHGRDAVLAVLTATGAGRLPANPAKAPFGDPQQTRLKGVLDAASALFESFDERDGILWIVTDNIIEQAPPGAVEVARDVLYNQEFYETLRDNPRWQVIHAWPVHRAPWLCSSTLMVYGLYYSSRLRIDEHNYRELCRGAEAQLAHEHQIAAFKRYAHAASPSPGQPFKLKPHDIDVVEISFVGQVRCDPVKVGMVGECRAQIKVENLLHHRRIDAAEIVLVNGRCDPWGLRSRRLWPVRIASPFCAGTVTKTLALPHPILPGRPEKLTIRFPSPPVETVRNTFADHWESANFDRFLMLGRMNVGIRNLATSMVIKEEALQDVYGVQSLPTLFRNPSTDNLQTSICLPLSVQNPSFFASLVLVALIATAVLMVVLVLWLLKPSFRTVLIDGVDQGRFRLMRIGSHDLRHRNERIGRAKLGWNGAPALRGVTGHKIRKEGNHWVGEDQATGDRVIIEVVAKRTTKRSAVDRNDAF
jgi:hypothetical protein